MPRAAVSAATARLSEVILSVIVVMARKPGQVTLAKPGARIRVCFTVVMVMAGTHHALPSIAVSDNIGAFVLGKACVKCLIHEVLGYYHPVNDSSAACLLTSTCAPLQTLKNIHHSHAVGLHRQEQWHHRASKHGIVNGVVNSLTVFSAYSAIRKLSILDDALAGTVCL